MDHKVIVPLEAMLSPGINLPVGFVPTPSAAYRIHRKTLQSTIQPGRPRLTDGLAPAAAMAPSADAAPAPQATGSRVLMWKQDPTVTSLGVRRSFLPGVILAGPRDARITYGLPGIAPVSPNVFGDFILSPNTDQFDAIHTFAIVRQTLTMYQRALASGPNPAPLPWQWNSASNTDALKVYPHGLPNVMNAYYSRSDKALKFGDFMPNGGAERVYTCRSLDIVSHETGHAVLDGLKPRWLLSSNPPQTGGLHESFGDLTAIFLTLSQLDQVEAVIAETKANLHDKTFLADMAEQFGLALGRPNGLRNADNDLTLSDTGNEVHAISQVFTGAIYDILADIFAFERRSALLDDAAVLHRVADYLRSLVLRSLIGAPDFGATFADVANQMLHIASTDGKPQPYLDFIRNRFTVRQVLANQPLNLSGNGHIGSEVMYQPGLLDEPDAVQDRRTCCGTMNNGEYFDAEGILDIEREQLARWCRDYHYGNGHDVTDADTAPPAMAGKAGGGAADTLS
ncbi:MAG: hypothetical protein V4754_04665 [Pseudomonadota bacterium]